jgi:hypothetical protein
MESYGRIHLPLSPKYLNPHICKHKLPFFFHAFRLVPAHCTDTSLIYLLLS